MLLRSERDSNSRYPLGVYTLSRRASSTTRASLQWRFVNVISRLYQSVAFNECKGKKFFVSDQIFSLFIWIFFGRCLLFERYAIGMVQFLNMQIREKNCNFAAVLIFASVIDVKMSDSFKKRKEE